MKEYSKNGCASDDQIREVFDKTYFKLNMVVKRIEFQDPQLFG